MGRLGTIVEMKRRDDRQPACARWPSETAVSSTVYFAACRFNEPESASTHFSAEASRKRAVGTSRQDAKRNLTPRRKDAKVLDLGTDDLFASVRSYNNDDTVPANGMANNLVRVVR